MEKILTALPLAAVMTYPTQTDGGPNRMRAYDESTGDCGTALFTREVFYLAVGCALFLAIHWLQGVFERLARETSCPV